MQSLQISNKLKSTGSVTGSILWLTILIALILSGCGAGANTESAASIHTLEITATESGWEGPETTPAGWTQITLNNQSDGMRQTAFYRLDRDKRMANVYAMLDGEVKGFPDWLTPYGGVSGVMPGNSGTVIADLPVGTYIVVDLVPDAEGVPGMVKGYFMELTVGSHTDETEAPAADLTVNMVDYAFDVDLSEIDAQNTTIEVRNSGPQEAHEVVLVKLDEGKSVGDFLAAIAPDGPGGPPPGQIVAGTTAIDDSTQNYITVDFEPGANYAFVCFLPSSHHDGAPHFAMGMIQEFSVPAQTAQNQ